MKSIFYYTIGFLLSLSMFSTLASADDAMSSAVGGGVEVWTCSYSQASDPTNPVVTVPIPSKVIKECTDSAMAGYNACVAGCPGRFSRNVNHALMIVGVKPTSLGSTAFVIIVRR